MVEDIARMRTARNAEALDIGKATQTMFTQYATGRMTLDEAIA